MTKEIGHRVAIGSRLMCLAAVVAFTPRITHAQAPSVDYQFQVVSPDGIGVGGIRVKVSDQTRVVAEAVTDGEGRASIDLRPGSYTYRMERRGWTLKRGTFEISEVAALEGQVGPMAVPLPGLPWSQRFNLNDINYFTTGLEGGREGDAADTYSRQIKFRVSVRYKLFGAADDISGTYFSYSQQSLWNLWDDSGPFFDNNYRPGVFQYLPAIGPVRGYLGLMHESNGRAAPQSRGWNRWYVGATFGRVNHEVVSGGMTWWTARTVEDSNADIIKYAGRGEVEVYVQPWNREGEPGILSFHGRTRIAGRRLFNNAELELLFQLSDLPKMGRTSPGLFVQVFHGYAESLRVYNEKRTSVRFGLSLLR